MRLFLLIVFSVLVASPALGGDCSDPTFAGASCTPGENVAVSIGAAEKALQTAIDDGDLGAGVAGAPTTAEYWTSAPNATLSSEVVIDESSDLAAQLSDETGSGALCFSTNPLFPDYIDVTEISDPANPGASTARCYAAAGELCCRDDGGVEVCMSDGGGGGASDLDGLTDVTLTSPATGATLVKSAGDWVDGQLDLADSDAVTGLLPDANIAATISRDSEVATHTADVSAHHTKTTSASELTSGYVPAARVASSHIDALTEIHADMRTGLYILATASETGVDDGECAEWACIGDYCDLTTSDAACGTGSGASCTTEACTIGSDDTISGVIDPIFSGTTTFGGTSIWETGSVHQWGDGTDDCITITWELTGLNDPYLEICDGAFNFAGNVGTGATSSPSTYYDDQDTTVETQDASINANATDTTTGAEDVDLWITSQVASTDTTWLWFDADDGGSPHLKLGPDHAGAITIGGANTTATNLQADTVDAITEIASGLKSGSDTTLITGTAGGDGICAEWNADGDLVAAVSASACGSGGGGSSAFADITTGTNSTATMTVGTGATITTSGSGTIVATTADSADAVAANSVALTTDTTGNYVASVATSSPLTGGAAGSEGATLTLGIDSATLTAEGAIEIATGAETNTGTDATRAVSPDGLDDWTGSAQITTVGTIGTGTWEGTEIADGYIPSAIARDSELHAEAHTIASHSDSDGSGLTGVDAATGDSATAFFNAGTIEHEYGGLEADVSAYDGLIRITAGATSNVTNLSGLNTALGSSIADGAHTTDTGPTQDCTGTELQDASGTCVTDLAELNTSLGTGLVTGAHTTDTNANTVCSGTTTYMDGEGGCDDISSVYQATDANLTELGSGADNWSVYYTNGSGVQTALALTASGQVLTTNGVAAAPTFETPGSAMNLDLNAVETVSDATDLSYDNGDFTLLQVCSGDNSTTCTVDGDCSVPGGTCSAGKVALHSDATMMGGTIGDSGGELDATVMVTTASRALTTGNTLTINSGATLDLDGEIEGTQHQDWQDWTVAVTTWTGSTEDGRSRRINQDLEAELLITHDGADTGLPIITHDRSAQISALSGSTSYYPMGDCTIIDVSATPDDRYPAKIVYLTAGTAFFVYATGDPPTYASVTNTAPFTFASGDTIFCRYKMTVSGW